MALAMLAACRDSRPSRRHRSRSYPRAYPPPPSRSPGSISIDSARRPSMRNFPPAALAFLEPFRQAHHVLIACTGGELLAIARGVVPGATQLAPDIALYGAPNLIAAATAAHPPAQHPRTRRIGRRAPSRLDRRSRRRRASRSQGNLANVNNLLHDTEYVTLAVQPGDPVGFRTGGALPSRRMRHSDSNRAFAPSSRWRPLPARASLPRPASRNPSAFSRDDRVVHVSLSAPLDALRNCCCPELIQLLLEAHRAQAQHRDAVHRQAAICGHSTSTPAPFRNIPRTISMK